MTFADDINRLFDELVLLPWSRSRTRHPAPPGGRDTDVDFAIPVAGGELGDISIALQGRTLVIRARRRRIESAVADESAGDADGERSFVLPEGAVVSAVEARFKDDVLHVCVRLRTAR